MGKDQTMKRKRLTEEQIIAILKEHEAGVKMADLCRKHGISEAELLQLEGQVRRAGSLRSQAAARLGCKFSTNEAVRDVEASKSPTDRGLLPTTVVITLRGG